MLYIAPPNRDTVLFKKLLLRIVMEDSLLYIAAPLTPIFEINLDKLIMLELPFAAYIDEFILFVKLVLLMDSVLVLYIAPPDCAVFLSNELFTITRLPLLYIAPPRIALFELNILLIKVKYPLLSIAPPYVDFEFFIVIFMS